MKTILTTIAFISISLLGLALVISHPEVSAEITINKPLLVLVDQAGVVVATNSTSIEKAMEKASKLPDGVYTLQRPDVTIIVNQNAIINQPPVAVTGPDQTVNEGEIVFLPCDLSYDPDGTIVKCEWNQIVNAGDPIVEILYTETGTAYFIKPDTNKLVANR